MAHSEGAAGSAEPVAMGRARITDVAARAGVSIKTVSRVMNDERGVRPETRERVLDAVRELRFVPNTMARSLKTGGAEAIGLLIDAFSDPFFSEFASVIDELALEHELMVLVASTSFDAERENDQLMRLAGNQLRGLIIAPVAVDAEQLRALRHRFPIVCADRAREGVDSVVIDDFGSACAATAQLIAHGHTRIGFVGREDRYPTNTARLRGFHSAMSDAGLAVDDTLIVRHGRDRASMAALTAELLTRQDAPTAVLCGTVRASIATIDAIRTTGAATPALISFGDFELADAVQPAITCIDQDPRAIATAAFERLRELIAQPDLPPARIVVPTSTIRRGSGELAPSTTRIGVPT
ncbi:MAG: LacI family DNA-binding transcriptional regulator [Microbacterium sp.]|uniref:LacI family DNA-binding transcriptional regulator n=1 Tax=Microbacterium sp. TaxID=51671 RepID=UPI0039E49C20